MTDARLMDRERSIIIDYPLVRASCIVHTRFDLSRSFSRCQGKKKNSSTAPRGRKKPPPSGRQKEPRCLFILLLFIQSSFVYFVILPRAQARASLRALSMNKWMHCPLLRWNGLYIRKIKSQLALKPNHLTCIAIVSTSFTRKQGEQRPTSNNHLNQREREGRIRGRLDGRNRLEPSLRETKSTPYNNSKIPNEIVSLIGRPSMKKKGKIEFQLDDWHVFLFKTAEFEREKGGACWWCSNNQPCGGRTWFQHVDVAVGRFVVVVAGRKSYVTRKSQWNATSLHVTQPSGSRSFIATARTHNSFFKLPSLLKIWCVGSEHIFGRHFIFSCVCGPDSMDRDRLPLLFSFEFLVSEGACEK